MIRRTVPARQVHVHVNHRIVAALALGAALVTSCSTAEESPTFGFGDCGSLVDPDPQLPADRLAQVDFACGRLQVPVDYAHPDGGSLRVQVVRIRHAEQHDRIGSLVLIPGGPGQSGLDYAAYWASALPEGLLERFDVVTFDPRGTGKSAPINCGKTPDNDKATPTPDVVSTEGFADALALVRRFTEACAARLGDRVEHFNTDATARDLDLLRQALGDEKLTYVGFSYGAKLGAQYAHLYPDKVRAALLDAPSDPRVDAVAVTARQTRGFEQAFDRYAADCPHRSSCAPLEQPRRFVEALVKRADADPIPSGRPADTHPLGGKDVLDAVTAGLYDDQLWPVLDDALNEADDGDSGSLRELWDNAWGRTHSDDPHIVDPLDAGYVINCNDRPTGPTDAEIRAAARRLVDENPLFGPRGSAELFACHGWQPHRHVLDEPTAPLTDRCRRHAARPRDALRRRRQPRRDSGQRQAADLGGRRPHRVPAVRLHRREGDRVPAHAAAARRRPLPSLSQRTFPPSIHFVAATAASAPAAPSERPIVAGCHRRTKCRCLFDSAVRLQTAESKRTYCPNAPRPRSSVSRKGGARFTFTRRD